VRILAESPATFDRFLCKTRAQLLLLRAAVAEEIRNGNVVCYGGLADLLLQNDLPAPRIRIRASPESRISNVSWLLRLSESEGAAYVKRADRARRAWLRLMYGRAYSEPAPDLVINLDRIGVSEAVITALIRQSEGGCQHSDETLLDNFALSTRVSAALASEPATTYPPRKDPERRSKMRKHLMYGVAVLAAAGLVFAAAAQQGSGSQSATQSGTMQGHMGMMQGRMGARQGQMGMNNGGMVGIRGLMMAGMQHPFGHSAMMAFLLPEMQSELGLSSSETTELSRLRDQFRNEEQKNSDQIAMARQDLNALFASGMPKEEQVKKAVTKIANLQAQRLLNGYETAAKMKATLTPEQRSRLDAIAPAGLWSTTMSHMTMNDMTQMMRFMYGDDGRMPQLPACTAEAWRVIRWSLTAPPHLRVQRPRPQKAGWVNPSRPGSSTARR
jgi:Spy/CpxP family protein refolding chaperone